MGGFLGLRRRMCKVSTHSLWVVSAVNPRAIPQPLTDSPSCGPGSTTPVGRMGESGEEEDQ